MPMASSPIASAIAPDAVPELAPGAAPESPAEPRIIVEDELTAAGILAQLVLFDIPAAHDAVLTPRDAWQVNLCLTPRPLGARAAYAERWGPHRYDRVGDIFMVPPGEHLHFRGDSGRQASLTCELAPEPIAALLGEDFAWDDQRLAATLDITSARIRSTLLRITEEVRHPGFAASEMLAALAEELRIEIARYALEVHERPATGGLASWRLRLIDERVGGEAVAPSLEELAAICAISVRQLTRGFRISRGCSIGDYIVQRRMETAKRLLVAGEAVKAIAFTMGFASPSSFAFAFRRAVGVSPSLFRQRQSRLAVGG
jgi:AraC family transcriptional regulator